MYDRIYFVKQKTAYEVRISDWSSDVCSSDLFTSPPSFSSSSSSIISVIVSVINHAHLSLSLVARTVRRPCWIQLFPAHSEVHIHGFGHALHDSRRISCPRATRQSLITIRSLSLSLPLADPSSLCLPPPIH